MSVHTMDDRPRPEDRPAIETMAPVRRWAAELAVAVGLLVLGFSARLVAALRGSGLDGLMYYDDGVNFATASCRIETSCCSIHRESCWR
jgi:hypothetical protein